jgi:hypothetical protein
MAMSFIFNTFRKDGLFAPPRQASWAAFEGKKQDGIVTLLSTAKQATLFFEHNILYQPQLILSIFRRMRKSPSHPPEHKFI